ncbi:hypothetical protein ACFDTO_13330 [Microbacteriaceae bacterium 4G12]
MNYSEGTEHIRTLIEELIICTATKQPDCSKEELLFSLNCLLRALHVLLDTKQISDHQLEYIETKFYATYNLITGKVIFP